MWKEDSSFWVSNQAIFGIQRWAAGFGILVARGGGGGIFNTVDRHHIHNPSFFCVVDFLRF